MTHHSVIIGLDCGVTGEFEVIEHKSRDERDAFVRGASMMLDEIAYLNEPDKLIGWRMVVRLEELDRFVAKSFADEIRKGVRG